MFEFNRNRWYKQLAIAFCCAFMTKILKIYGEGDWGKFKRLLKYMYGSVYLTISISSDDLNLIKWYVPASFTTHKYYTVHTGSIMMMGKGGVVSISKKQNINAKLSTKTKHVGIHKIIPQIIWLTYSLQ